MSTEHKIGSDLEKINLIHQRIRFGTMPQKLQEEYMDICEGIHSEIVSSNRFDKNSDLSTMYLGSVHKENQHKLKAEESFPISEHGYILG